MAKSSLQRSHSATSNFKLTAICFFLGIAVILLWVGLAILKVENGIGIALCAAGGVLTLVNLFLVSRFTR